MKITAVKTFMLEHPLPRPVGPSCFYYRSRATLIVKLETDEGLVGWGETDASAHLRSIITHQYAPALIGRDPLDHRKLWRELWGANFGDGMALGGVDIALDDLRGKILGVSVGQLYGGRLRDRVAAYASSQGYVEGEDAAELFPREAAEIMARGFKGLKLRIGGQPIDQDLKAITAVRKLIGPKIKLMADGNGAYTIASAIQMGRELEKLGLYWFEEPLPQESTEYPGYEILADALDIPIAACECLTSRGLFKSAITRRAMDIVQPDVCLAGGIGECLFVAELARLWGIPCMPHCWSGPLVLAAATHLVSLLPDASWSRHTEPPMLEMDATRNLFREELLTTPLDFRDGFMTVPTGPGLGVEVDEDRLKRFEQGT